MNIYFLVQYEAPPINTVLTHRIVLPTMTKSLFLLIGASFNNFRETRPGNTVVKYYSS
jgi:hypothetical protein